MLQGLEHLGRHLRRVCGGVPEVARLDDPETGEFDDYDDLEPQCRAGRRDITSTEYGNNDQRDRPEDRDRRVDVRLRSACERGVAAVENGHESDADEHAQSSKLVRL